MNHASAKFDCDNIDHHANAEFVRENLEFMLELPAFQQYKKNSISWLADESQGPILEVGCGTGDDAAAIAAAFEDRMVVGADKSAAMLSIAANKHSEANLSFQVEDVQALTFQDHHFGAVRIDRTLQHVPNPEQACKEISRVLHPGGILVAIEPDWQTSLVDHSDEERTTLIVNHFTRVIRHRWIGRQLPALMTRAGLTVTHIQPVVCLLRQLDPADKLLHFQTGMKQAVENKLLTTKEGKDWWQELVDRDAAGQFTASLTLFMVLGKKPLN